MIKVTGTIEKAILATLSHELTFSYGKGYSYSVFTEILKDYPILATLLREISWSSNLNILSKTKDETVVEYSLSKSLSPTLIAEYETKFINKHILQEKINKLLF